MRDDEPGDAGDSFVALGAVALVVLGVVLSVVVALTVGSGSAAQRAPSPTTTTTTVAPPPTTVPALPAPVGLTVGWSLDGEVLVRGLVQSDEQRDAVVDASEAAFGAENVDSGALVVASDGGVNADDRIGLLVSFVDRMPQRLLAGSVLLQDQVLTLNGILAPGFDETVFDDLIEEADAIGVATVTELEPAPELAAFSRTYELTSDGISLFGTVATEEERVRILTSVAEVFPDAVVDDALMVAEVSVVVGTVVLLGETDPTDAAALRAIVTDGEDIEVDDRLVEVEEATDADADAVDRLNELFALEPIRFQTNSATIQPESAATLDRAAEILTEVDGVAIRVEGHTDSLGDDAANLVLSQRRAEAVVDALIERGIAPERLEAVGFGESRPIADNTTPEGREQNRRIELSLQGA